VRVAEVVQGTIQTVREISSNLHPHHLDRLGFCAAIEAMRDALEHSSGLSVTLVCDPVDRILPKETEIHVYRIIQEALTNVVRHSGATMAEVRLKNAPGQIEIEVSDNGRGFSSRTAESFPKPQTRDARMHGFGLPSMHERARIVGGRLTVDSTPGSGTRVALIVPHP